MALRALALFALPALSAGAGEAAMNRAASLERAWDTAGADATPVARVVGLLKKMSEQLTADMDQDEKLYKELECWCDKGKYEKQEAIKASSAKIDELKATIEGGGASTAELKESIKELEAEVASDKTALKEALALREKQLEEFHNTEKDSIQALENLKAAITVLSKHQNNAPDSSVAGGPVFKTEQDSWSLLAVSSRRFPWSSSSASRSLDDFMRRSGMNDDAAQSDAFALERPIAPHKFLQQRASSASSNEMSAEDKLVIQRAMKAATAFMQAKHEESYTPAYNSQSGEIFGVLTQLEEEMAADLKEAQETEQGRAGAFQELRSAKEEEIANGEKMAEEKEDQLANGDNSLAEAKEDLAQEEKVLASDQEFLANLDKMCEDGDKNFEERKKARLEEMRAVAETIDILQADESRDAMSSTYGKSFLQVASSSRQGLRARVAANLRAFARRAHSPKFSLLATSVELDSFTKVKKAIDEMISMLKVQQDDEVKKNDWCRDELHQNEMTTEKRNDLKADLEAEIDKHTAEIKDLEDSIEDAKAQMAQVQLDLQRAGEDRKKENLEFQQTVADQTVTVEVLKKALDRLATFYDLSQTGAKSYQTPPVQQMEYKENAGSSGVMEMIEKLVHEAEGLKADARKGEQDAQAAYEQTIADSNKSVEALQREISSKSEALTDAQKDKRQAESDHADTVKELDGLAKYNGELHAECDYLLKNFEVRQNGRQEEVEALQQAMQILNGADMS